MNHLLPVGACVSGIDSASLMPCPEALKIMLRIPDVGGKQ